MKGFVTDGEVLELISITYIRNNDFKNAQMIYKLLTKS